MNRREAIDTIYAGITKKDAVVSSTGLMSREIFRTHDSDQNFYMVGSMGLASSIGLSIAINNKSKNIVVVEGDASALMSLSTLASVGHFKPENFTHIVLDNRAYASCSEEPSISQSVDLLAIARAAGYGHVYDVDTAHQFAEALAIRSLGDGPVFIHTNIELGGERDLPRPLDLPLIASRFKTFLTDGSATAGAFEQEDTRSWEEHQENDVLLNRFADILTKISQNDIEKFKGIGIVMYDSNLLSHTVHTNTHLSAYLRELPNIFDDGCIESLLELTKCDSPYHDGFIFIDQNGNITDIAQYFVPPIVPSTRPRDGRGIRYNSSFYGSYIPGVIATGMVSSKKEPILFQNGIERLLP